MCGIIPVDLLTISSPVEASLGSYENILNWTTDNLLLSQSTMKHPYFTIDVKTPIYVCSVKLMSNPTSYAYPKQWTLSGIDHKNNNIMLLQDKPGLCDGNKKADENGELCKSNTITR